MSAAKRHVTFGVAHGATFPISQDIPESIVRRWIRDALALPPEE